LVFHVCLLAVPIGLSQHVEMWQDAGFDWMLFLVPDRWADILTLLVLSAIIYFGAKRCFSRRLRSASGGADYFLLVIAALPFLTGYLETNGQLDFIPWVENYMYTLHVLSGEAFILTVAVLICRTGLHPALCTGCAACTLECPTGALSAQDGSKTRRINYVLQQCIRCGRCVAICPDEAARLTHAFELPNPFRLRKIFMLAQIDLAACGQCGSNFVPVRQHHKLRDLTMDACVDACPDCRQQNHARECYRQIFDASASFLAAAKAQNADKNRSLNH
jgi:ferredoxin